MFRSFQSSWPVSGRILQQLATKKYEVVFRNFHLFQCLGCLGSSIVHKTRPKDHKMGTEELFERYMRCSHVRSSARKLTSNIYIEDVEQIRTLHPASPQLVLHHSKYFRNTTLEPITGTDKAIFFWSSSG